MDKVVAKSKNNIFPIVICVLIGVGMLIAGDHLFPLWVPSLLFAAALFFFISIRTVTVSPNEFTTKFIWQQNGKSIKKEDIKFIKSYYVGNTSAQRAGMIKQNYWIEIRGNSKRDILYITETGEQAEFLKICELLHKHYHHFFDEETANNMKRWIKLP